MYERNEAIPFAQFRFHGEVVSMTRAQFEQALRDGKLCYCENCLACRAVEYAREARYRKD